MRRIHSPFLPRLIRILAFVTAVAMTVPAAAQGADGVANPMSLRSVIDLLSRYTDLEPRQRLDVEEAHDRYLEAFERLRDGRIQDFMDLSHRTEAGSSGSMPSLEQMEKLFAEWEDVNRRVASLDTRFLEEIGAVLDARQAAPVQQRLQQHHATKMGSVYSIQTRSGPNVTVMRVFLDRLAS